MNRGCLGDFVGAAVVSLFMAPIQGFAFMLAVGVVHHEWWPAVPTIGFWWAVLFVALIRSVFYYSDGDRS